MCKPVKWAVIFAAVFGLAALPMPGCAQMRGTTPVSDRATRSQPRVCLIVLGGARTDDSLGCDQRGVANGDRVPGTMQGLRASLARLLALPPEPEGPRGSYNALGRSRLHIEGMREWDGTLEVGLRGRLVLGGMCDGPRVAAQLKCTARQMPGARRVDIELNGEPLSAALSLQ